MMSVIGVLMSIVLLTTGCTEVVLVDESVPLAYSTM